MSDAVASPPEEPKAVASHNKAESTAVESHNKPESKAPRARLSEAERKAKHAASSRARYWARKGQQPPPVVRTKAAKGGARESASGALGEPSKVPEEPPRGTERLADLPKFDDSSDSEPEEPRRRPPPKAAKKRPKSADSEGINKWLIGGALIAAGLWMSQSSTPAPRAAPRPQNAPSAPYSAPKLFGAAADD